MNGSYYSPKAGSSAYYERSSQTNTKKLAQPSFEIKPTMDLCNLYVKGIEPGLTSSDLFNLFKPFGRIISARVMEETGSNSSSSSNKGFGFVSFSQSIEAAQALIAMHQPTNDNNHNTMGVRFHEPRVPRPEHNFSHQLAILSQHSELAAHFYTRSNNKIVPLRTMILEDKQDTSFASQTSVYYTSPPAPPPPYYYPAYWTDHRGVVYTNVYHPYIQPSSSMIYHDNDDDDDTTRQKLLGMLEQQANISPSNQKQLKQKLLGLSRAEQISCIHHPVYFKEKINAFLLQSKANDNTEQDAKK
jgi:RNA recognition motif-containing protein